MRLVNAFGSQLFAYDMNVAAVSWGPNRIDVFVRGMDDHLGHLWWNGTQWNGWQDLGGPISSAPAVASWTLDRLDVFAAGSDNNLTHKWWNGSAWSDWDWIGGVFHDNPAAVSWAPFRIDVFVRGMDKPSRPPLAHIAGKVCWRYISGSGAACGLAHNFARYELFHYPSCRWRGGEGTPVQPQFFCARAR